MGFTGFYTGLVILFNGFYWFLYWFGDFVQRVLLVFYTGLVILFKGFYWFFILVW